MTIATSAQISALMGQQQSMFYNNAAASQQISAQMFPGQFQQPTPMQQSYGPPPTGPGMSGGEAATRAAAGLGKALPGAMMTASAVAGMVGPAALGALEPFGAGMMAARAGGGMLSAGGMAAGIGAAGAVALPYMAMQHAATNITGGMQEQMQLNSTLRGTMGSQFMSGGRGLSTGDMGQVGQMLRGIESVDPSASFGELNQLVGQIHQQGMMSGVNDVQQFKTKFKEIIDTTRDIAKTLGTSLSEAGGFMGDVRTSGFYTAKDIMGQAKTSQVMGGYGFSGQQMRGIQRGGADLAQAYGARRKTGAVATTRQAQMIQEAVRQGTLSDDDIMEATGGVGGAEGAGMLAQRFAQQQFKFSTTSVGRAMLLATGEVEDGRYTGKIDKREAARLRMGLTNVGNLKSTARGRIEGREGKISFRANEEKLRGSFAEEMDPQETAMAVIQQVTGGKGFQGSTGDDVVNILMKRFTDLSRSEADVMVKMAKDYSKLRMTRAKTMEQEMDRLERKQMQQYGSFKSWVGRQKKDLSNALQTPELRQFGADIATGAEGAVGGLEAKMFGGGYQTEVGASSIASLMGGSTSAQEGGAYDIGLMTEKITPFSLGDTLTDRDRRYARRSATRGGVMPVGAGEVLTGVPGMAARAAFGRGRKMTTGVDLDAHLRRQAGDTSDFAESTMSDEATALADELISGMFVKGGLRGGPRRGKKGADVTGMEEAKARGEDPIAYLMRTMSDSDKQELAASVGGDWREGTASDFKGTFEQGRAEVESRMEATLRERARETAPEVASLMKLSGDIGVRLGEKRISELEKLAVKGVAGGAGRKRAAKNIFGSSAGKSAIAKMVGSNKDESPKEFKKRMLAIKREYADVRKTGDQEKMKAFKRQHGISDEVDVDDLFSTVDGMLLKADDPDAEEYLAGLKELTGDVENADKMHGQKIIAGKRKERATAMVGALEEGTDAFGELEKVGITADEVSKVRARLEDIGAAGTPQEQAAMMKALTRDISGGKFGSAEEWEITLGSGGAFGSMGSAMGLASGAMRGEGKLAENIRGVVGTEGGSDEILAKLADATGIDESVLRSAMAKEGNALGGELTSVLSDDKLDDTETDDLIQAIADGIAAAGDVVMGKTEEGAKMEKEKEYYDSVARATTANKDSWKYLETMVGAKPPGDDADKTPNESGNSDPDASTGP